RRMDEHATVAQHWIEPETVGRRHREELERAGDDREDEEEERDDRSQDARGIGSDLAAERAARDQRRAAEEAEDQRPVEERPLLATVEPCRHERDGSRYVGVLGHVRE